MIDGQCDQQAHWRAHRQNTCISIVPIAAYHHANLLLCFFVCRAVQHNVQKLIKASQHTHYVSVGIELDCVGESTLPASCCLLNVASNRRVLIQCTVDKHTTHLLVHVVFQFWGIYFGHLVCLQAAARGVVLGYKLVLQEQINRDTCWRMSRVDYEQYKVWG